MNPYEGLNLPQLLDLLKPLVEPTPVSWAPQTQGWMVLGAWALVMLALLAWRALSHWQANRYRREALAELKEIRDLPEAQQATQVAVLLKRTALATWPREQVAGLHGSEWAAFLRESTGNDAEVSAAADDLAGAAYQGIDDPARLLPPARRWIEVHQSGAGHA